MKTSRKERERGQATLEFVVVLPILLSVIMLALALAVGWHLHHLSASLSLEGASLESAAPGQGFGFTVTTGNRTAPGSGFSSELAAFPYAWLSGDGVQGSRFSVIGKVHLPWAPLQINLDAPLRGSTYAPVWEFNGAP